MEWSCRIRNEFASVTVTLDDSGNTPRLRIVDERSHSQILLDPLELAALSTCSHADFAPFMEALRIPGALPAQLDAGNQ
jgi:hypothetical protein